MSDVILKDQSGDDVTYSNVDTVLLNTTDGGTATYISERLIQNQVQADWSQTDDTQPDYIKNKPESFESEPELPEVTTDDNGKVLGVVDGVWQKTSISSSGGSSVQSDWNQNDNSQPDYIKNRPFYDAGTVLAEVLPETTIPFDFDASMGGYMFLTTPGNEQLDIWNSDWTEMTVVWDGTTYVSQAQYVDGMKCIGNVPFVMGTGDTNEPFMMFIDSGFFIIFSLFDEIPEDTSSAETKYHTISLSCEVPNIIKIPTKYLYQPDWDEVDEFNGAYIKNKPFGIYMAGTVIFDGELSLYGSDTSDDGTVVYIYFGTPNIPVIPSNNSILELTINDVIYENTVTNNGSEAYCTYSLDDGSTLKVYIVDGQIIVDTLLSEVSSIVLALGNDEYVKVPNEYLPAQLPEVTIDDNGKILTAYYGSWVAQTPASGLPSVTTSDNNKVLKVVDGVWTATNELPVVTEDDNGKVLAVSGGAWTVASSLPTVTIDDAGKFLRVSAEGLWVVESVPNAEEASF